MRIAEEESIQRWGWWSVLPTEITFEDEDDDEDEDD
jgi:hypothetical protein